MLAYFFRLSEQNKAGDIIWRQHHHTIAVAVRYLQQKRVFADPLNGSEKVALQGNICAFLPTK